MSQHHLLLVPVHLYASKTT